MNNLLSPSEKKIMVGTLKPTPNSGSLSSTTDTTTKLSKGGECKPELYKNKSI